MTTLAQNPHFLERVSDNWSAPGSVPVGWLLLAAAALLCVLLSLWAWRWYRTWDQRSHPLLLFWQLARDMGLSIYERLLLIRIARHQELPSGLTLLASRQTLRIHALNYAAGRSLRQRARVVGVVARVRRRLFP